LYVSQDTSVENDNLSFVKTVAALMSIEYLSVPVDTEKDKDVMEQTNNGKLPVLLLEDG
jgi:glutathione S-transferase